MRKLTSVDVVGKTFGYWKVLSMSGPRPNVKRKDRSWCRARCTCGRIKTVAASGLRRGIPKSCGCLQRGAISAALSNPDREAGIALGVRDVLESARVRDIAVELDKAEIGSLIMSPCFYCGCSPVKRMKPASRVRLRKVTKVNGIDRKNSSGPYSKQNCVACCPTCNKMKSVLPVRVFLAHVHRIARNHPDFDRQPKENQHDQD